MTESDEVRRMRVWAQRQAVGAATLYDQPSATDGRGGPHPLAGVPQAVLDAATQALQAAVDWKDVRMDAEDVEPVAHAVLSAALQQLGRE